MEVKVVVKVCEEKCLELRNLLLRPGGGAGGPMTDRLGAPRRLAHMALCDDECWLVVLRLADRAAVATHVA